MVAKEVGAKVEASQLLNTSAAISRGGISFGARDVVKNPSVSLGIMVVTAETLAAHQ